MLKLVLFDLDGTLVDTLADIVFNANETLTCYGYIPSTKQVIRKGIGLGVAELLKAAGFRSDDDRLADAVIFFKARYSAHCVDRSSLYKHTRELLEVLRQKGIKMALLTNKPDWLAKLIVKELELRPYLELIIGEGAGYPMKPVPQGALALMKHYQCRPEETVLVGDSLVDRDCAQNAGIDFICVSHGYDDRAYAVEAGHQIFSDMNEVGSYLQRRIA